MPLTTYSPTVRPHGYDLINQAFNRFISGQLPRPAAPGQPQTGGGGEGGGQLATNQGGGGGQISQNQGGGSLQTNQQPQKGPQVPDFFNRQQTPAFQAPDAFNGQAGFNQNPGFQGGQGQAPGQQGPMGNLGSLLALLGPLQSGQGFLGMLGGQGPQGHAPKPAMFPSFLQQQAGQYGNTQGTPLEALFQPGSYSGPAQYGMAGGGGPNGQPGGIGLNPQIQSQALAYILSQLAQGGMGQQPQQPQLTGNKGA